MRRTSLVVLMIVIAACSFDESDFQYSMKRMDKLVAQAKDPATGNKIKAMKAELQQAFKKLPQGEARKQALTDLCMRAMDVREKAEDVLEQAKGAVAAKAARAEAQRREPFVGIWRAEGMELDIHTSGKVRYVRKKGASSRNLTGTLSELHKERFKVSVLGIGTTFTINTPPAEQDGIWSMTIDGAKLHRVMMPGTKYTFGLKICLRYLNGFCLGERSAFKSTDETINAVFDTQEPPQNGVAYSVRWIAEAVKTLKPGAVIAEPAGKVAHEGGKKPKTYTINSFIKRPTKGFKPGSYRVEARIGGKVVGTKTFTIAAVDSVKAAAPAKAVAAPAK